MSMRIQNALELLFDPGKRPFRLWIRCTDAPAATLYHAALCGFRSLVEQVLSKYPQYVNAMGGTHGTVLHAASRGNHP
jgi:hypothetical protein